MSDSHANHFENPSSLFLWFYSIHSYFLTRKPYKKLIKELELTGSETIMEFGSGVGSLAKKLATVLQNQGQLTCVDVNEKFLNRTKKKLKNYSNVKFLLGEISEMELLSNSFDYIVATWVLHHVKKNSLEPSIQKFFSILKDTGKIFVIEFPDSQQKRPDFNEELLLNIFKKYGFAHRIVFIGKRGILYEFSKITENIS